MAEAMAAARAAPTAGPTALIALDHIGKTYDLGLTQVVALRDIDLAIQTGELVAIIGQSGSGKSTLMNIIGLLDTPTSGIYRIAGRDVSELDTWELAEVRRERAVRR
jgi:ABC-type lipoprotein export system ATPase subunit